MADTPPLSPSASSFLSSTRSLSPDRSSSARGLRQRRSRDRRGLSSAAAARAVVFAASILSALCAGSVTVFSLYGHIFQERLHYTQLQVNGVAIGASIALYIPVSLLGYLCDRVGPAPLSLLSSVLFAGGYGLAAVLYRQAAHEAAAGHGDDAGRGPAAGGPSRRAYASMVGAFVAIGAATCAMYLSAVATCAKNFGRGRHRGLALAAPIAAFGLSGMWQSQFGSRVLYERLPPRPEDGPGAPPRRGDLDVFAFFVFLAVLLAAVGLLGTFTLRVVDEDQLIDDAVEQLERSGLLDGSALFSPTAAPAPAAGAGAGAAEIEHAAARPTRFGPGVGDTSSSSSSRHVTYGTMGRSDPFDRRDGDGGEDDVGRRLLDPRKDGEGEVDDDDDDNEAQARRKKTSVLNAETRRFLADHTMWLLALGFFFMIGPGEAFINNLGTVIQTLYPPPPPPPPGASGAPGAPGATTAATHVSIVGMTSTIARLLTGTLTDLLAPRPQTQTLQVAAERAYDDDDDDGGGGDDDEQTEDGAADDAAAGAGRVAVSRVAFLLAFALLLSAGLVVLASGAVQNHGDRFWIVSGLVGAGYGAVFSLTPIIITVIWGVENFGTNWGIVAMVPALGATLWGLVYSTVYQAGVVDAGGGSGSDPPAGPVPGPDDGNLCYGTQCYAATFWAMAASVWVACVLVLLAWKGRNGWAQRGIVI